MMASNVPHPNTRGFAKQHNDNIAKLGTTARTTDVNRRREDKQARKARLKAKHRGTHTRDRSITVNSGKEQPRNPDQLDEQQNDNDPNHFTSSIKLFDELPPPGEDEPRTWAWQLRMLVWRRLSMSFSEYCEIDWNSEFDFQKFQAECVESDPCYIYWYRRKRPVPIPCLKHSQGTNLTWRRHDEEYREHLEARFAAEKKKREEEGVAAWAEECKRIERAIAESPDLWLRDKRWEPVGAGVALIAGTMVQDVATFFCDCDITVEEANLWSEKRRYTKEGRDIVAQIQSGSDEVEWSTHQQVQVRISVDKFRRPGHASDLEHTGHAAVRGLKGRHGNALCAVILFLGRTGEPVPDKIDDQCCYWLFSASGFSGPDLSKLGQNDPFRMVRLSKISHRDHIDFMRRFGLRMGKERAEAFSDGFNRNVRRMEVTPLKWEDFRHWNELPDDLESVGSTEDDDLGHDDDPPEDEPRGDDRGGEDPGEEDAGDNDPGEDDTVEEDNGGDDPTQNDPAEDYPAEDDPMDNAGFADGQDIVFEIFEYRSELNRIAFQCDEGEDSAENDPVEDDPVDDDESDEESDDEPDNGFRCPVPGWESGIPEDFRGGGKVR